jgi:hypothetical protein
MTQKWRRGTLRERPVSTAMRWLDCLLRRPILRGDGSVDASVEARTSTPDEVGRLAR